LELSIGKAPGKGLEPLRAKGPLAILLLFPARFIEADLEASAITAPPPRHKDNEDLNCLKEFSFHFEGGSEPRNSCTAISQANTMIFGVRIRNSLRISPDSSMNN
jgi:hypothetical protein